MIETDNITSIQTGRVDELTCSRCKSVLDVSEFDPFTEIDCPACAQKLTIPARLGAFLLLHLLGKGGMLKNAVAAITAAIRSPRNIERFDMDEPPSTYLLLSNLSRTMDRAGRRRFAQSPANVAVPSAFGAHHTSGWLPVCSPQENGIPTLCLRVLVLTMAIA